MPRFIIFFIGASILVPFIWFTAPPFSFPTDTIISVEEGVGLQELAIKLEQDRVIRSPFWFRMAAIILGGERHMQAGEYYMEHSQGVFVLAWRVLYGDHKIETVKITIPEGFNNKDISNLFDKRFVFFDHQSFLALAPEGYLFPDTYFMPVSTTASSTIKLLHDNFVRKTFSLMPEVESFGKPFDDVIKMASIIESEAKFDEDRVIVSGILWKRIKLGMPLQVDSDPDTYLHVGFPPQPITNPGLKSIAAALHPTTTPYLYFLTADDGTMHYSKTFDEHVKAKLKYIH